MKYKIYVHYKDGLIKKNEINGNELEATWDAWLYELTDTQTGDGITYLKIRRFEPKTTLEEES